jgi:hypothetical protein
MPVELRIGQKNQAVQKISRKSIKEFFKSLLCKKYSNRALNRSKIEEKQNELCPF